MKNLQIHVHVHVHVNVNMIREIQVLLKYMYMPSYENLQYRVIHIHTHVCTQPHRNNIGSMVYQYCIKES